MKIKELLLSSNIILDCEVANQIDAFKVIAEQAVASGITNDAAALVTAFLAREAISSTGFENGIALPHAQSDQINQPAIIFLRLKTGVDWQAIDGQSSNLIIAIMIPKNQVTNLHLDVISNLSIKLVNPEFRHQLQTATNQAAIIALFDDETTTTAGQPTAVIKEESQKQIVGISSCTTGVVHTYMCKELLEQAGKELGYQVHIECQGQKGPEYVLSSQQIQQAEVVILATDVAVELDRFQNKKVFQTSTRAVVKNPKATLETALKVAQPSNQDNGGGDFILSAAKQQKGILKHLLSGVSFMIPFVVFAGLIFAIDTGIAKAVFGSKFAFQNNWIEQQKWAVANNIKATNLMHILMMINNIATIGFTMMIPIMGAYIAYSIAGRPGIAPAMIVTFILVTPPGAKGTGVEMWWDWGGIFNLKGDPSVTADHPFSYNANISWTLFGALYGGLVCGYLVRYVNNWKVPQWLRPIMPIIIIPVFCTALVAIPTAFLVAAPFGFVVGTLNYGLSWMGLPQNRNIGFLVGLILGAMVGFDLGGPINKTAVLVATSLISLDGGRLMGPVAAAIPIAPLGCALTSTLLGRKLFSKQEKSLGWNAWLLGFMGISESAIPFAARDTWRVIIPNVIGSAVAGALTFVFGVCGHVGAWGGFIIALFGGVSLVSGNYVGILWYCLAIVIGMLVHSLIYTSLLMAKAGSLKQTYHQWLIKLKLKQTVKPEKVII